MEKYDVVILGATFLGVGIAKGSAGKCLIIEAKAKPGYEFIDSFGQDNFEKNVTTKQGEDFYEYFKNSQLLDNPFIPEWTAFLSNWICKNNIECRLFTNALKIEDCDGGKLITVFGGEGKSKIFAQRIVDTRTKSLSEKSLNAVIYGDLSKGICDNMQVAFNDGEFSLVKFRVPTDLDYTSARKRLYEAWENRPKELKSHKIAAVADEFYETADVKEKIIDSAVSEIYSSYYSNPFTAFDSGVIAGGELCD